MSRVVGGVARAGAEVAVGEQVQVERGALGSVQFWRGSTRYVVGELLDSWVETGPWWRRPSGGASADLVAGRGVWWVEAGLSRAVTDREADDLVRDVGGFLTVVEHCLGDPEPRPARPRLVGGAAPGGAAAGGTRRPRR